MASALRNAAFVLTVAPLAGSVFVAVVLGGRWLVDVWHG